MEPYSEAAWAYRGAGWVGVLPLPAGAKWPPPGGFTGWAGVWPSGADVQAWVDGPQAVGNIALRLPASVYGLDVDDYDGKTGAAALGELVERLGPLPPTWIVSSRDASLSGIRLYRAELAPGRHWRDEPGGHGAGIEAVHLGHRYAVVWPSTHPETGRRYVWRRPDGLPADDGEVPALDGLPDLPASWIEALSEPGEPRIGEVAGHEESVTRVNGWRDGEACARVRLAFERAMGGLAAGAAGAALHPALVTGVHELCNLGHEGHAGVRRAEGISAQGVDGTVATTERRRLLAAHQRDDVQVICNAMVLTEGWDAPWCSAVVIARPTSSGALYVQMAGRGLRPHPGKRDALIIDVVGVTGRHRLASIVDLGGVERPEQLDEELSKYEPDEEVDLLGLMEPASRVRAHEAGADGPLVSETVDLFGSSRQTWLRTRRGVWFLPAGDNLIFIAPSPGSPGQYAVARCPARLAGGEFLHVDLDLELAMSWGEQCAVEAANLTRRSAQWRKQEASTAQRNAASRVGIDVTGLSKGELSDLLSIESGSNRIDSMAVVAAVSRDGYQSEVFA